LVSQVEVANAALLAAQLYEGVAASTSNGRAAMRTTSVRAGNNRRSDDNQALVGCVATG
jgi:hypothetical protein